MSKVVSLAKIQGEGIFKKGEWVRIPINPDKIISVGAELTGVERSQEFSNNRHAYYLCQFVEAELFVGEVFSELLHLFGKSGAENGQEVINQICRELFSNPECGTKARSIKIEDLSKLTIPMRTGYYYLSNKHEGEVNCGIYSVAKLQVARNILYYPDGEKEYHNYDKVRPLIVVHKTSKIVMNKGTYEEPHELVVK